MTSKAFVKTSIECFALAQRFLPKTDKCMKANISHSRATAILSGSVSSQFQLAIKDARTYVEQYPSFEVIVNLTFLIFSYQY